MSAKDSHYCRFWGGNDILGETRPGLPPIVYLQPEAAAAVPEHESVHVDLLHGSTHGLYLVAAAWVRRRLVFARNPERRARRDLERRFELLYSKCRLLHEACATAVELNYVGVNGRDAVLAMASRLPRFYQEALEEFRPIGLAVIEAMEVPDLELVNLVFQGIARACMDTGVFDALPDARTFWSKYALEFLNTAENIPDSRFRKLARYVARHKAFVASLREQLEGSQLIAQMRELSSDVKAGAPHGEVVRRRWTISREVFRVCVDLVQGTGQFPVDDSVVRRDQELTERFAALIGDLKASVGIESAAPPRILPITPETFRSPVIRIHPERLSESKNIENVSGAELVQRLAQTRARDKFGAEVCSIVILQPLNPAPATELRCCVVQLAVSLIDGGAVVRIEDGRSREDLPEFRSQVSAEQILLLTDVLKERAAIIVATALEWAATDRNTRARVSKHAHLPLFLYEWAIDSATVAKWMEVEGPEAPLTVSKMTSNTPAGDERFDVAVIAVGPGSGGSIVRFGLALESFADIVLHELANRAPHTTRTAPSDTELRLAAWTALKVFSAGDLEELALSHEAAPDVRVRPYPSDAEDRLPGVDSTR